MSKITLTLKQQEELRKNRYVKNVTLNGIIYTDEFKHHCIQEIEKGKTSTEIFHNAGFDLSYVGTKRAHNALDRWKRAFNANGVMGLRDTRNINSGRPSTKELTQEELIKKQKAEIQYLKQELEFVKKLDMIERGALKQVKKNTKK